MGAAAAAGCPSPTADFVLFFLFLMLGSLAFIFLMNCGTVTAVPRSVSKASAMARSLSFSVAPFGHPPPFFRTILETWSYTYLRAGIAKRGYVSKGRLRGREGGRAAPCTCCRVENAVAFAAGQLFFFVPTRLDHPAS